MNLLKQLELLDIRYDENNKKAVLIFLDEKQGEIREVNFNKQSYDQKQNKFIDDEEKAAKVEKWCEEHFGLSFNRLREAIGVRKDVYCYDNFNSLFEVKIISKFEEDMVNQIFETRIVNAFDDGKKISLQFEYEGNLYESKMKYSTWLEARQAWFVNPSKKKKQYDKFQEKFQIPVENIAEMIGKTVLCEVKKAMGKYIYIEIKPFKKLIPKKAN